MRADPVTGDGLSASLRADDRRDQVGGADLNPLSRRLVRSERAQDAKADKRFCREGSGPANSSQLHGMKHKKGLKG
jgi:hypothetical protein